MDLAEFLSALFEHGRVRVKPYVSETIATAWPTADAVLVAWDQHNRLDFPGEAPQFSPEVGRWASAQFYRACQFAVFRDTSAEVVAAALAAPCPPAPVADQHYTVDLVFRFLPDLLRIASLIADADPLCEQLRAWGRAWPLSSVGIVGLGSPVDAMPSEHAGLLRVYGDRVIARRDKTRLTDPRVRAIANAALGHFPQLAPDLAVALQAFDVAEVLPILDDAAPLP